MKPLFALALVLVLSHQTLAAQRAQTLEVRFCPDSVMYVYEEMGPASSKQLFTGLIQNMAFVNTTDKPVIIQNVKINSVKGAHILQTKWLSRASILRQAAQMHAMKEQGLLDLYDFQFQTSRYLKGVPLSASDTLKAGEAIIVMHEVLLFDELPERVEVVIEGKTYQGASITSSGQLTVSNYKSKNTYILPLKGRWMAAAAPSLVAHHRWASVQEFAFDFIKTGHDLSSYRNSGTNLTDYYAYAESVYAIGDGTVVSVLDEVEEPVDNLKKANETEEAYFARVQAHQQALMKKGFTYIFGNHVIIRHPHGEYSMYFHLKRGSVGVKAGDKVKQGQQIGALGHSGNSTEPHLHFHVSNSADILYSRSLPVVFNNIKLYPDDNGQVRHLHAGQIIVAVD